MEIIIAFIIFMATMLVCLITNIPMFCALLVGLVCFMVVGIRKGFSFREVSSFAVKGTKDAFVVIEVMLLIGLITALWRSSGTITFFVYYGIKMITPQLFIVITFILSSVLSYALGTSFGVAGTVGVIFMALARSGGVNEVVAAGAIMSGIYFGDRTGPASSSANLVALVTETELYSNVRMMVKTGAIPMIICTILYVFLSLKNPIHSIDASIFSAFHDQFNINLWLVLPAILMLVLPLFKIRVKFALSYSIIASFLITMFVQNYSFLETLKFAVFGYNSTDPVLGKIINGGGMVSMIEICIILTISCSFSGIFTGTNMLDIIQIKLEELSQRTNRYITMIVTSSLLNMVFCNQTIASMMSSDLLKKPYLSQGGTNQELAIDIENSCIVLAGVVPWCIACSVPLSMMQVGYSAMPYAFFMYIMPISYIFTKKIWYK